MIPVENSHEAQITSIECNNDDANQQFTVYNNGEIVHDLTGFCLGPKPDTEGIFSISSCADSKTQGFHPKAQTDGTYILYSMDDVTMCATQLDHQDSSVAHRECGDMTDDQKWSIGSHEWSSPTFTWVEMGCGYGVETSYADSESYSYIDSNGDVSEAHDDLID